MGCGMSPTMLLFWFLIYYVDLEIYPPLESLAEAEPRLNFPAKDKPLNLRVDVVYPIHSPVEWTYVSSVQVVVACYVTALRV